MGKTAWAMREPKSRAGFMLEPEVPASARIKPKTREAMRKGPGPGGRLARLKMQAPTKTSRVVAIISQTRLAARWGMAGWLQKQLSLWMGSGVWPQCGKKCSQTRTEPTKAPSICAEIYGSNLEKSWVTRAEAKVTAGLMWASWLPQAKAVKIPAMAAKPHPVEMAIQPAPSALERLRTAPAMTPLPSVTKTMVPMNSPTTGDGMQCSLSRCCFAAPFCDGKNGVKPPHSKWR